MTQPLEDWFEVTFDDSTIYLDVHPPEKESWSTQIPWVEITRICFKPGDFLFTDEIYIFTDHRPESYLIPTEASGGFELWMEVIRRGFFDADLAIKAASADEGIFCWPEEG